MKSKLIKVLIFTLLLSTLIVQSAFAGTATWKPAVETSYDLSFPGTILVYKDELNQGGLNLQNNTIVSDKNSTDLVFDTHPDIAARGVKDLGTVSFDTVTEVPDAGYSTDIKANPGHVYLVLTHDNNFAKVLIKSVIGQRVLLKYALATNTTPSTNTNGNSTDTNNQIINNNITNQIVNNSENNSVNNINTNNSVNNNFTDNSTNSNYVDNSINSQVTNNSVSLILNVNKLSATVNGSKKSIDVAPFVENGRTLVPLRFVGESLGATVDWKAADQSVTLKLGNTLLVLWLNKTVASVNGKQVLLDVPAKTYKDRTVVPIRFVSENLGLDVGYNDKTQEISVKNKGNGSSAKPTTTNNTSTANNADLADFFHLFSLVVPGAVNQIPIGFDAVVFKATPGALAGGIAIYADGTYIWNSPWDGKVIKGKWARSSDSDYPLTILDGEEGKDWKLGRSGPNVWGGGDIVIWDGSIFKNGTKVK
ncbi:MAG: copper amine oxidase N-terminal domain-containing protein [Carboxydocellales bacterium]